MKTTTLLLLCAAGAAIWYFLTRRKSDTREHLDEQKALQKIARLANHASMAARPAVQTYDRRGPYDGAVIPLIDAVLSGVPGGVDVTFRPTLSGDPATLLMEDL